MKKEYVMQLKKVFNSLALVAILLCGACAPGLGKTVRVNAASAGPRDEAAQFFANPVRLHIFDIRDARREVFIGEINGRSLLPKGNIPAEAIKLVEKSLAPRGVSFSPNATIKVVGALNEWFIEIDTGFPMSKASARATVDFEVTNELLGTRYRGTYSGTSFLEHPFMREKNVEEVLGWALQSAVDSALEDGEFLAAIGVL